MLCGMAIPGDSVGEEDVEGASSDGYRTPPDFMPTLITTPPFTGKTRKRRKTREAFYKGYGVVYLPGEIKGPTDKLHILHWSTHILVPAMLELFVSNFGVLNPKIISIFLG